MNDHNQPHATRIIETISRYFLMHKITPVAEGAGGRVACLDKLADHHAVRIAAMKAKHHADPAVAQALRAAIERLDHHGLDHTH